MHRGRFTQVYNEKLVSLEEALSKVKSNDSIVVGLCATEPQAFLDDLHTQKDRVDNVEAYMCLPMKDYTFFSDPSMKGHFQLNSWFHTIGVRKGIKEDLGLATFQPNHLHSAIYDLMSWRKINIFVGACTPPDHTGHVNLSCSLPYEKDALENAEIVILEVNENLPRVHGDTHVRVDDVDYFYESNHPIPTLGTPSPTETDIVIGNYCADLIEDGSTLQIGIGGIPSACTLALMDHKKKDLGVHTEMFVDSMVDLYEAGIITNKRKTIWKDKFVASFALGSQRLYDFINDNMAVELHRGPKIIDPSMIRQNYNMVSINTTIMVDLTGQAASETIGPVQYSGTGGQFDTACGARDCVSGTGGKSILTCYSANRGRSSIVPMLPPGSAVTMHRSTIDYVITEYGIAHLKGRDIRRRVESLINIAHPDFRPWLREEAKKLKYIDSTSVYMNNHAQNNSTVEAQ